VNAYSQYFSKEDVTAHTHGVHSNESGLFKVAFGKRPDSGPNTVLACDRAAQCTVQE